MQFMNLTTNCQIGHCFIQFISNKSLLATHKFRDLKFYSFKGKCTQGSLDKHKELNIDIKNIGEEE